MQQVHKSEDIPVTLVVTRRVAPECHAEFQAWMRKGVLLAAGFPGFLGAGVLAPSEQGHTFQILLRFTDEECMNCWERSLSRRMWLEHGAMLMQSNEVQHLPGVSLIFGQAQGAVLPPRWKRASSLWLFVYPVSFFLNSSALLLFPDVPLALRVMMVTLVQVPLMIYVGAPLVNRVLRRWLYPRPVAA